MEGVEKKSLISHQRPRIGNRPSRQQKDKPRMFVAVGDLCAADVATGHPPPNGQHLDSRTNPTFALPHEQRWLISHGNRGQDVSIMSFLNWEGPPRLSWQSQAIVPAWTHDSNKQKQAVQTKICFRHRCTVHAPRNACRAELGQGTRLHRTSRPRSGLVPKK